MKKYLTFAVIGIIAIGILLIIVGQATVLNSWFPGWFSQTNATHTILKSIGVALLGSGVFTAIIKSDQYSKVFSDVIGEVIWSKKFIERRSDKKAMWSMISKVIYEEKFPLISDEIEDIITTEYFPTSHEYYIENYELTYNISNVNDDFWKHSELLKVTVKTSPSYTSIMYPFITAIDLPDENIADDLTDYIIEELYINGTLQDPDYPAYTKDEKYLNHRLTLNLSGSDTYNVLLKRTKILCKKSNPDKTFFAKNIIKNLKVTIMIDAGINFAFKKMGTVKNFMCQDPIVNNNIKVLTYNYNGLILPHQGFVIIFKL